MATRDQRDPTAEQPQPLDPEEAIVTMLRLALDGLPSEQRAAIQFATVERLTVDEIAGKIGRTVGDTRIAMRDGLSTLRDVLHALDPAFSAELGAVDAPSHR